MGEILTDTDSSNILTDGYCLSPYTCKCCIVFKQFDRLNFDGLAGKHQKRQNFPLSKFDGGELCIILYIQPLTLILLSKSVSKYINGMVLVIVAVINCRCFLSVSTSTHCVILHNNLYAATMRFNNAVCITMTEL